MLLLLCDQINAQQPLGVAVLGFKTANLKESEVRWFSDSYVDHISSIVSNLRKYYVIPTDKRTKEAILRQIEDSLSELSIRSLGVGKKPPADLIVVGTVTKTTGFLGLFNIKYYVTVKLIGVEKATTISGVSNTYKKLEDIWQGASTMIRDLMDKEIILYTSTISIEPDNTYTPRLEVSLSGEYMGILELNVIRKVIPAGSHVLKLGAISFSYEFKKYHEYSVRPVLVIPKERQYASVTEVPGYQAPVRLYTSATEVPGYSSIPKRPEEDKFPLSLWTTILAAGTVTVLYAPVDQIGMKREQVGAIALGAYLVCLGISELSRTASNTKKLNRWENEKRRIEALNERQLRDANNEIMRNNQRSELLNLQLLTAANSQIMHRNQEIEEMNKNRGVIFILDIATGTEDKIQR